MTYTIRRATPAEAPIIAQQRRGMFRDMGGSYSRYLGVEGMDEAFVDWVIPRIETGEYIGWFAVNAEDEPVGGAGLWIQQWTPQVPDLSTRRAYVMNVYVEAEHRRQGLARQLLNTVLESCRSDGIFFVLLHASDEGRPLYASLGFEQTNEMRLTLL
jgi:GNAT superfamily N-acetyltransferase